RRRADEPEFEGPHVFGGVSRSAIRRVASRACRRRPAGNRAYRADSRAPRGAPRFFARLVVLRSTVDRRSKYVLHLAGGEARRSDRGPVRSRRRRTVLRLSILPSSAATGTACRQTGG